MKDGMAVVRISRRILVLVTLLAAAGRADDGGVRSFRGRDTLAELTDAKADAQDCLRQLGWKTAEFPITCEAAAGRGYDYLVRFPSPVETGDATNDSCSLEWYAARDAEGRVRRAPAVVVVHESGSEMPVGRLFARGFQAAGFHALMLHLPHYGCRRTDDREPDAGQFFKLVRQAVADCRRARDAVAALPEVDAQHVALQGTSLGGFVVALVGSLDRAYGSVFITLAAGDLYGLVMNGQREAAEARRRLEAEGLSGDKLKDLLWKIEPLRIAHRLDPQRTWLYTAELDQVVPLANSVALAQAAGLAPAHHVRVAANHYTAIVYFPVILQQMSDQLRTDAQPPR